MTLGTLMKEKRDSMNRTRQDMSEQMNVSVNTVINWESDGHPPNPDKFGVIMDAYQIDREDFGKAYMDTVCPKEPDFPDDFPFGIFSDSLLEGIKRLNFSRQEIELWRMLSAYVPVPWYFATTKRIDYYTEKEKEAVPEFASNITFFNLVQYLPDFYVDKTGIDDILKMMFDIQSKLLNIDVEHCMRAYLCSDWSCINPNPKYQTIPYPKENPINCFCLSWVKNMQYSDTDFVLPVNSDFKIAEAPDDLLEMLSYCDPYNQDSNDDMHHIWLNRFTGAVKEAMFAVERHKNVVFEMNRKDYETADIDKKIVNTNNVPDMPDDYTGKYSLEEWQYVTPIWREILYEQIHICDSFSGIPVTMDTTCLYSGILHALSRLSATGWTRKDYDFCDILSPFYDWIRFDVVEKNDKIQIIASLTEKGRQRLEVLNLLIKAG